MSVADTVELVSLFSMLVFGLWGLVVLLWHYPPPKK